MKELAEAQKPNADSVLQPLIKRIDLSIVPSLRESAYWGDEKSQASPFARLRATRSFCVIVLAPLLVAITYFGFLESDMFVSSSKFLVRSVGGDSSLQLLGSVVNSPLLSKAPDETYAVAAFISSRDAVAGLEQEGLVSQAFNKKKADVINRFPNFYDPATEESRWRHFKRFVDVSVDGGTGIISLDVTAFTARDAQLLTERLLQLSEGLINRLNTRSRLDAVEYTKEIVVEAEDRLNAISSDLAKFRNREMVMDPTVEASVISDQLAKMSAEVAKLDIELAEQVRIAPASPGMQSLRAKINSYHTEMDHLREKLVGAGGAMAGKLEQFSRLVLQQNLATKSLESAILSLDKARNEVQQKRIYIERVVSPNLPDEAVLPRRILYIFCVLLFQLCLYWIAMNLYDNIRGH